MKGQVFLPFLCLAGNYRFNAGKINAACSFYFIIITSINKTPFIYPVLTKAGKAFFSKTIIQWC